MGVTYVDSREKEHVYGSENIYNKKQISADLLTLYDIIGKGWFYVHLNIFGTSLFIASSKFAENETWKKSKRNFYRALLITDNISQDKGANHF